MGDMPSDYTTVFYDDFSGSWLDTNDWPVTFGGGTGSNGAFTYSNGDISTGAAGLTIATTDASGAWTTGGFSQGPTGRAFGLYQVDAKVDPGQGTGPVVVLWPDNNAWPPEIDLLEAPGGQGDAYMTLHWAGSDGSNQYSTIDTGVNVGSYHDYAVDWEPDQLTFYVDGRAIWSTTQHIPQVPMALGMAGFVAGAADSWYGGGPDASTPATVGLHVAWASISEPDGGAGAPYVAAITPASVGSATASGQSLYSTAGTDILLGGTQGAADTFYASMGDADGWTEIDNWRAGDLAVLDGANAATATIDWSDATDPNGQSGATAAISLNGDGVINERVTFAGISAAALNGTTWQNSWTNDGTPNIGIHG